MINRLYRLNAIEGLLPASVVRLQGYASATVKTRILTTGVDDILASVSLISRTTKTKETWNGFVVEI